VSIIDLNNPPPNYHYSLSVNREETRSERNVRLIKELGVFGLAIAFVSAIFMGDVRFIRRSRRLVGYLVRK
jgi:hypothetical protein